MRFLLIAGILLTPLFSNAGPDLDSLLQVLNTTIDKREVYQKKKLDRIEKLTKTLARTKEKDRLGLYIKIYDEYKSFHYDSAFRYATKIIEGSYRLRDPVLISQARVRLGFVLVSSGLFTEALDTLHHVRSSTLPDSARADFFYLMARTSYDLADFNRDEFYSQQYSARANRYIDSAMAILPAGSARYLLLSGLKDLHLRELPSAQSAFEELIRKYSLSDPEFAVAASTLSFIYFYSDKKEESKEMLIRAAIADIRSCTKETLATLNLADMLYKEGDVESAYRYVKIAMEDANFYGAQHRKVQVSAVFPVIEGRQLTMIESKRQTLLLYAAVITLIALLIIGFAAIIYTQFKKLQAAKKLISEANDNLTVVNHQLVDANKIKEEYILYYFTTTAEYITKLDNLKKSMDLKLMTKKLEDLRFIVDSINIKKERNDLYHNFDLVFLKLFPDFVTAFNALFREEDRIVLKEGQLLNTELRIFALMRMGITDHEKIAKILDYSVTTIYTYKTRVRSKSIHPNTFESQIMAIRAL